VYGNNPIEQLTISVMAVSSTYIQSLIFTTNMLKVFFNEVTSKNVRKGRLERKVHKLDSGLWNETQFHFRFWTAFDFWPGSFLTFSKIRTGGDFSGRRCLENLPNSIVRFESLFFKKMKALSYWKYRIVWKAFCKNWLAHFKGWKCFERKSKKKRKCKKE